MIDQQAPAVHVIEATGIYTVEDAQRVLKLRASTIRRECRLGRLRIAKRAGRYFLLGEWLLEWLRDGELPKKKRTAADADGTAED